MSEDERHDVYESFEKRLRKSLRVDTRYSVLDFKPAKNFLYIFTDVLSNAARASRVYQKESPGLRIKVILLPDGKVGRLTKGICHVGVAPVRRECNSASEQITQVLYGETFDTLQLVDDWARVRLHADGYVGWVSQGQVTLYDEDGFYIFQSLPKAYVCERAITLFEKPDKGSSVVREAVYGNALSIVGNWGAFVKVKTPDGFIVHAMKSAVKNSPAVRGFSLKRLIETALAFRGISYVWGGRSAKGFDCSGFMQTVFRLNGVELPRDSGTQFSAGRSIGKNLDRLRAGDLLFFSSNGDKINHVALYLGKNKMFIHSSGFVRVNSFDPKRKDFSRKLLSGFVGACRVI